MKIIIKLKKSRPLLYSYKGKEKYEKNRWQDYEILVLLTDEKNKYIFARFIKQMVIELLNTQHIILLRFSEINQIIMNEVSEVFINCPGLKIYPLQKNKVYYKPGMIISTIIQADQLDKIFHHWGNVELFQVIVIDEQSFKSVMDLLEKDVYELSVETLLSILKFSDLIIRDSGDGNEAELMYHRRQYDLVKKLLSKCHRHFKQQPDSVFLQL